MNMKQFWIFFFNKYDKEHHDKIYEKLKAIKTDRITIFWEVKNNPFARVLKATGTKRFLFPEVGNNLRWSPMYGIRF